MDCRPLQARFPESGSETGMKILNFFALRSRRGPEGLGCFSPKTCALHVALARYEFFKDNARVGW
jgi:hypothetical protein